MDVFEVYIEGATINLKSPENYDGEYYVRKLPMKARIDWKKTYGDDGTNNWYCDHIPWIKDEKGKLIWDY